MSHVSRIESLEGRRLLSFASADASFGKGGLLSLGVTFKRSGFDSSNPAVVPLADGRIVVSGDSGTPNGSKIRYLRGDGNADTKRGNKGFLDTTLAYGVAIDNANGRVAIIRRTFTNNQANSTIELYDPKGRVVATDVRSESGRSTISFNIAFTPDGGLIVASREQVGTGDDPSTYTTNIIVRRFDASLEPLAEFNNGEGTLVNVTDVLTVGDPFIDESRRVYLPIFARQDNDEGRTDYIERLYRMNSDGTVDTTYGDAGVLTVYRNSNTRPDATKRFITVDRVAAPDGTLFVLTATKFNGDVESPTSTLTLTRIDPSEQITSIPVGRPQYAGPDLSGQVALGRDGEIFVCTRGNGSVAQLYAYRIDLEGNFIAFNGWDGVGGPRQTTMNISEGDLAIDSRGAVLLAGEASNAASTVTPAIYRFNGPTNFAKEKAGVAQLRADGTLLIKGTTANDTIILTRPNGAKTITVSINKAKAVAFKAADVRGLVIQTGRGNDRVDLGAIGVPGYVEGGAGNDTLLGTNGHSDTLVGDAGNDQLEGRGGDDHLYGEEGDDLLLGGTGGDELFGNLGNDRLYASGLARNTTSNDYARDLLDGGRGGDFLRRDSAALNAGDTLIFTAGEDTVAGE